MISELKIPELGENITSGRVASVLVAAGDALEQDQIVLELETDKAVIEIPSTVSGTVKEVLVAEGDDVAIGQVVLRVEQAAAEAESVEPKAAEKEEPENAPEEEATVAPAPAAPPPEPPVEVPPAQSATAEKTDFKEAAPAAPSVRRFAREIGIDIHQVPGSGPGGRISVEDVKNYSKMLNKQRADQQTIFKGVQPEPLPDFSRWGEVEVSPMNKVREKTAQHLSYAWATVPHVTQFDKADITELEELRKRYAPVAEKAGGKLTITAILLKVVVKALQKFPQFNASIDMLKKEIIYKKYYNIGVAVDTDRGLLVPVIRDVDQKSLVQLAVELSQISAKARDKKIALEDLQGGNFSISNLGGIGGTGFTPIVNAPEVAILGVSRSEIQPVYRDGEFVPRLIMPLSLSYDHRLIDGADAARFLRWVCQALEEPFIWELE
ncbi:MAG TPA: branched-chain alpha-keto acid dehydrogenase subunit E2 [Caldithrix abyssi]|uniref:Dihydrolipoamide acetyltransferase component of pyruvate dehydrogenase complex n=1 Tax=Caldithrix abyssi TaxID=187145 RepID=A0A7V5PQQ4_CALAY|nr:branched-chain alpha-keto acid dehydrogenase subunit E2 [Caldithrix abyssi]